MSAPSTLLTHTNSPPLTDKKALVESQVLFFHFKGWNDIQAKELESKYGPYNITQEFSCNKAQIILKKEEIEIAHIDVLLFLLEM